MLNVMRDSGVIADYALFGAAAQMKYTEPVATLYAEALVKVPSAERSDPLAAIYQLCANRGYQPEGEAVRVGAWPVQFIPVFNPLTQEALKQAETADFEGRSVKRVGGTLELSWDSVPGTQYTIQKADVLQQQTVWTTAGTKTATGGTATWSTDISALRIRFYRVKFQP